MIVPSIDLLGGRAVQLQRGEQFVLEREDVFALAERFGRVGTIAVVDLDAAFGRGDNGAIVRALCRVARCRVGGGLRDADSARAALRAGAEEIVIGTAAAPPLLAQLPRDRTIVAIDARGDSVVTRGWTTAAHETPLARARRLDRHCGGFLFTRVEREGMLGGPDFETANELRSATKGTLTVAGGVTTVDDVVTLDRAGIDAQVGMALYTGALNEAAAFAACVRFERMDGLVPTIVCDEADGRPRMLAYSTRESLRRALREGTGVYWSRSRNALWRKGDTSGNVQRLVRAAVDCDRDALVFYVLQDGPTCHTGAERCFGPASFAWQTLVERIDERLQQRAATSYTVQLAGETALLDAKVREEAEEVITAETDDQLAWECADLLYFMSVKMRSRGISLRDVFAQLAARAT